MDVNDEISRCKKEKWFEVLFSVEALGVTEDVVKNSLEKHIEKLSHIKELVVYEKKFSEIKHVKNPMQGVESAYSYFVNVRFFAKTMSTLLNVVLIYGPSSVEVLGPNKKEIDMSEAQDICNVLAGMVHQFAAAGIGGIVITPEEKRK
jgi:hypothetical protein